MNRKNVRLRTKQGSPASERVINAFRNLLLAEDFVTDERRLSWQLACTKHCIDLP